MPTRSDLLLKNLHYENEIAELKKCAEKEKIIADILAEWLGELNTGATARDLLCLAQKEAAKHGEEV